MCLYISMWVYVPEWVQVPQRPGALDSPGAKVTKSDDLPDALLGNELLQEECMPLNSEVSL